MIEMNLVLTNDDRRYLGLPPLGDAWDELSLGSTTLVLDGNRVRRRITRGAYPTNIADYAEDEIDRELSEYRTKILPATGRGKSVKLTEATARSRLSPSGISVHLGGRVYIVNHRTQHDYPTDDPQVPDADEVSAEQWLAAWKRATTPTDLAEIETFSLAAARKHVKYREGDVFAFRLTRREWGFGRVLLDRAARHQAGDFPKTQKHGYMQYLGRVVLVQLFHALAPSPSVDLDSLVRLPALPSHMVMDGGLFYGEWPIIGHRPVEEAELDHELLIGRSLDSDDTWFMQDGWRYAELPEQALFERLSSEIVGILDHTSFAVTASGPGLRTGTLRACIEAGSNDPHWEGSRHAPHDLRNPQNASVREALLRAFGA